MLEIVKTRMKNAKLQEKNKSARVKSKPRLSVGVSGTIVLNFFINDSECYVKSVFIYTHYLDQLNCMDSLWNVFRSRHFVNSCINKNRVVNKTHSLIILDYQIGNFQELFFLACPEKALK